MVRGFFSISVEALLSLHFSSLYLNVGNYKTCNYQWLLPNQKKNNELLLLITWNNLIFFAIVLFEECVFNKKFKKI